MSIFKFAENILKNLYQTTQTALNNKPTNELNPNEKKSRGKNSQQHNKNSSLSLKNDNFENASNIKVSLSSHNITDNSNNNLPQTSTSNLYKNASANSSQANMYKKSNKDDELISFLNNTDLSDLEMPRSKPASQNEGMSLI